MDGDEGDGGDHAGVQWKCDGAGDGVGRGGVGWVLVPLWEVSEVSEWEDGEKLVVDGCFKVAWAEIGDRGRVR